ncbi:MAG: hypothetical protein Q9171_002835 [Xanthocarpia ochracea]
MASRCPKTLLGAAVSGASIVALHYIGGSINPDLLFHVEDLIAATPTSDITFEEIMPSAIPAAVGSCTPDFVKESLSSTFFTDHDWSLYAIVVLMIWALFSSLLSSNGQRQDKDRVIGEQADILERNQIEKEQDQNRISDLEGKLRGSMAKSHDDADHIRDLEKDLQVVNIKAQEAATIIVEQKTMIRNLRQSEEKLAKTVKGFQGQVDSLTVDKDEKANTIAQLGQENGKLASKIVGLESKITKLQADNTSIKASSKMNQDTIARQNTTITELQKKHGQQKCTIQNLNDNVRTLEREKVSTANAFNTASFKSKLMQTREDALKTQYGRTIESLHCRIRALESQVEADCKLKEQQKGTLLGLKDDLKHRGYVIDELHDRISLLQGQLNTANTALTNAENNSVPAARNETAATGTEESPSAAISSTPALNGFLVLQPTSRNTQTASTGSNAATSTTPQNPGRGPPRVKSAARAERQRIYREKLRQNDTRKSTRAREGATQADDDISAGK